MYIHHLVQISLTNNNRPSCWHWRCFSVSLSKCKWQVIIPAPCGKAEIVPAWEVSGLWSCWICTQREAGTSIRAERKHRPLCSAWFFFSLFTVDFTHQIKKVSLLLPHSPYYFFWVTLSLEMVGWIRISACFINLKCPQQLKKTLWCDFNLALLIKDRRAARAATVDMLSPCSWEKNDICLFLIPGAASGQSWSLI